MNFTNLINNVFYYCKGFAEVTFYVFCEFVGLDYFLFATPFNLTVMSVICHYDKATGSYIPIPFFEDHTLWAQWFELDSRKFTYLFLARMVVLAGSCGSNRPEASLQDEGWAEGVGSPFTQYFLKMWASDMYPNHSELAYFVFTDLIDTPEGWADITFQEISCRLFIQDFLATWPSGMHPKLTSLLDCLIISNTIDVQSWVLNVWGSEYQTKQFWRSMTCRDYHMMELYYYRQRDIRLDWMYVTHDPLNIYQPESFDFVNCKMNLRDFPTTGTYSPNVTRYVDFDYGWSRSLTPAQNRRSMAIRESYACVLWGSDNGITYNRPWKR